MRITKTTKRYFYFSLTQDDYNHYGYYKCRQFLNAFKKELPGGKNGERFWLAKMNCWAINNGSREKFNRLLSDYFDINQSEGIFQ